MFDHLVHLVTLLGHWGYLVIFLGVLLECAAFFGMVFPGETLALFGGFLASQGVLDVGDLIILVCLGAILGDSIGYEFGRRLGRKWLLRYGRWVGVRERHLIRAEQFFADHGGKAVLLGRTTAFLRAFTPFVAGASRMPYRRFVLYNAAGGILWSVTFVALGYVAGASWRVLESWIGRASIILAGLVALGLGTAWLWRKLVSHEGGIRAWAAHLVSRPRVVWLRARYAAQFRFLADRLRPGGVFGLHLTIGTTVLVFAAWVFGEIADAIIDREQLAQVDERVAMWLHAHATPEIVAAARVVSWFGASVVVTLCVLLALLFTVRRQRSHLLTLALILPGGAVMNLFVKHAFHRSRPVFENPFVILRSYSFPSGHSEAAALVYAYLAALAVQRWTTWRARVSIILATLVVVLLVGFSRMLLGVHYLSDVLAGYAEAAAWLAICLTVVETLRRSQKHRAAMKPRLL